MGCARSTREPRSVLRRRGGVLGVGVLPIAVGEQSARLVRLTEPLAELALPLWILTREDLRDVPRVRAVMDFCAEAVLAGKDLLEGRVIPIGQD